MPYSLSLRGAFLIMGFLLMLLGGLALLQEGATKKWLHAFPRSRGWGLFLLTVAALWFWWLIRNMDLGEFGKWRDTISWVIPVAALLGGLYVDEMLAARALGMVVLLGAEPLLEAAFLQPELSRLFLVTLTYAGILAAMFWIGMPYTLRDQMRWISQTSCRLSTTAGLAATYGLLLVIFGLTLHRSI